jgi:hypothetical protein
MAEVLQAAAAAGTVLREAAMAEEVAMVQTGMGAVVLPLHHRGLVATEVC